MLRCIISLLLASGSLAGAARAVPLCAPPDPPSVPDSDGVLKEYANFIQADFDDYFADLTDFTACLDHARAAVLAQAQGVSLDYRTFLDRARTLGVIPTTPADDRNSEQTKDF